MSLDSVAAGRARVAPAVAAADLRGNGLAFEAFAVVARATDFFGGSFGTDFGGFGDERAPLRAVDAFGGDIFFALMCTRT